MKISIFLNHEHTKNSSIQKITNVKDSFKNAILPVKVSKAQAFAKRVAANPKEEALSSRTWGTNGRFWPDDF